MTSCVCPTMSRRDWRRLSVLAAIVAIVGVAVVVRFMHLTALGFNSDEAVYTGQAGSLAGVGAFGRSFSPFRAHPLLLQTVLAIEFLAFGHMSEYAARATVALMGVAAVFATYRIGSRLYGVPVGLAAAAGMAIMPYHVFISRQVLLDVPAGLFVLLAFGALYRYDGVETRRWLYLAGALAGVACVIKETMIIFFPAAVLYLFWEKLLRKIRWRDGIIAAVLMGMMLAPFVGTRFLFSGSSAGGYVIYQLFRAPNHPIWYFPVVFWIFITPLAVLAVVGGIVLACVRRERADKLLVSWLAVFGLFFQFWPTKLLPYAIILTPAMALLGARGVVEAVRSRARAIHPACRGVGAFGRPVGNARQQDLGDVRVVAGVRPRIRWSGSTRSRSRPPTSRRSGRRSAPGSSSTSATTRHRP